ncbi:alpha-L-fucosidase [Pontiellaceae bacterium B1224]|nr:alpha-L-fucosidase [Pontiellaceae bacterium B1224]
MQKHTINRRNLLGGAAATAALTLPSWAKGAAQPVPSYLKNYGSLYAANPRAAALKYFQDADFGLFIHYGLYSLLGRGEWVQLQGKIPVMEYAKLKDDFTAENFDAAYITDMAMDAGMNYINITTRHHDSFCLFDSKYTDFKSTNSPAKRDLVAELAEQCQQKGLGFYLYYSHGRDWRHPHAPNNGDWGGNARPKYDSPEPFYKYGDDQDLQIYVEFMKNQITELLTNYGPVGGIWLDGEATPKSRQKKLHQFKTQELYDHIHAIQPQALISYKHGLTGTEDFKAPERKFKGTSDVPLEFCDTLQNWKWGYSKDQDGKHKNADQVMEMLANAEKYDGNLLLNVGPLPDGSIHPEDVKTLAEVGKRLRKS